MGLRGFVKAMRSRMWIVLLAGAVVGVTALLVSISMKPTYQGEATVLLTQQNAGTMLLGSPQQYLSDLALQREVQTQVNVMQSPALLRRVVADLKLDESADALKDRVNVRFDGQTDVVTIDVRSGDSSKAADIANAIAMTYVDWSLERQRSSIRAAADDVQKRLAEAQAKIVAAQAAISDGDGSGARQVELKAANDLYGTLTEQLTQLQMNEQLATGSGSVLSSATPDPAPVSPKPVRNAALGVILGLILGLGIAVVVEALDNTIKTSEDAEELYGAPVLCRIPEERRSTKKDAPRLTLVENPGGPAAEAYRMLRNNLGFINFEHDIKTILVTSAMPNEGKSTVAANLAVVLARAGKRVVLLSCDFHQPGAASLFDVNQTIGLSDVLGGRTEVKAVLEQPRGFENLWVIPTGAMPPNPSELLGSTTMERLVRNLRDESDWVILDSAPLLAVADAAAVARWIDGTLMVARAGTSTRETARRGREQLDQVGARVLGVALWGQVESTSRGGYEGYVSGYGTPPTT